jgi:hypothetical protein
MCFFALSLLFHIKKYCAQMITKLKEIKNFKLISLLVLGGLFLFIFIFFSSVEPKENNISKVSMLPHKALYEIKMVSKSSGAQILNISGKMFYEWENACEGWLSNHRFNLFYEYADSPAIKVTSDFSTFENFEGSHFNFNSRRKRNGELFEEFRGYANISNNDKNTTKGLAEYSIPEDLSFELSPNTLFPMKHTQNLLKKIQDGQKFYSATIFDGSDEDGPVEINTFIGARTNIPDTLKSQEDINLKLLESQAWKARMAFFPVLNASAESDYEMDIVIHENGVISDMLVEYKDFSVSQRLIALEKLENKLECDKSNSDK